MSFHGAMHRPTHSTSTHATSTHPTSTHSLLTRTLKHGSHCSNKDWQATVLDCLYGVCLRNAEFTVDTLREECDAAKVKAPQHCNAWGAIFTTAARQGWMSKTGRYTDSVIPRSRGRMISVWHSNLNSEIR